MVENATVTIRPEPTIRPGIRSAQRKPMIDCLEGTLMPRHVSMKSRSRYCRISSAACELPAPTTVVAICRITEGPGGGEGGSQAALHGVGYRQIEQHDVA